MRRYTLPTLKMPDSRAFVNLHFQTISLFFRSHPRFTYFHTSLRDPKPGLASVVGASNIRRKRPQKCQGDEFGSSGEAFCSASRAAAACSFLKGTYSVLYHVHQAFML